MVFDHTGPPRARSGGSESLFFISLAHIADALAMPGTGLKRLSASANRSGSLRSSALRSSALRFSALGQRRSPAQILNATAFFLGFTI